MEDNNIIDKFKIYELNSKLQLLDEISLKNILGINKNNP